MANDAAIRLNDYRAELPYEAIDLLGSIRGWSNIQVAIEEDKVWIKGFTEEQVNAPEIKQLPGLVVYVFRDGLLFLRNALVPSQRMRTALLWSPVEKALQLSWPDFNHNYFGIHEKVTARLIRKEEEQPAFALCAKMKTIKNTIVNTPAFKLAPLKWTVVGENALVIGTPLLAFPGQSYWQKDGHLLPSGWDFEFNNVSILLQQKYNPDQSRWLLWERNGSYIALPKAMFRELSLSSFRLTENIY
ncbi:MAG: hypothetical protein JNM21_13340 [Taibaiella sp.]|nr:hypothetical protein [Taibaiella sp.]